MPSTSGGGSGLKKKRGGTYCLRKLTYTHFRYHTLRGWASGVVGGGARGRMGRGGGGRGRGGEEEERISGLNRSNCIVSIVSPVPCLEEVHTD